MREDETVVTGNPEKETTNADILRELKEIRAELAAFVSLAIFAFWMLLATFYLRTVKR